MRFRKNGLCKILLVILFLAFISGGCGGGSSGSGGNSQGYNGNGNSDGNDGGQSGKINGTWEIVSGRGTLSGAGQTFHLTYVPGKIGAIGVEVSPNTTWGENFRGAYCVTLTGEGLAQETIYKGTGTMTLYCTVDERPNQSALPVMAFSGGMTFDYIGNNTYQDTEKTYAKYTGVTQRLADYESTLTLEDSSTLRWTYRTTTANNILSDLALGEAETLYEIVLKRAGSSYNPDDYTNNTAPNTNTNTNTSPTPTPNTNTNTNTQSDIPPQISGTWHITSGSGLTSQTVSGRHYVSHLTYSPQRNDKAFDIDITQNDTATYYGDYAGLFSLTLTGHNIINSGSKGAGALRVSYSVAEAPGKETSFTFTGGKSFSYIGNGTYKLSVNNGTSYQEQTITLEDESTIRWKYTVPSDGWYEIVLTKE